MAGAAKCVSSRPVATLFPRSMREVLLSYNRGCAHAIEERRREDQYPAVVEIRHAELFPLLSNANPIGTFKVFAPGLPPPRFRPSCVKSVWPRTVLAAMPLDNGGTNSYTVSCPHRPPRGRRWNQTPPHGQNSELAETPPLSGEFEVNAVAAGWPNSKFAAIPVENGGMYSSTRLLTQSET